MDQNTGDGMRPNTGMNYENTAMDENKNAVGAQNSQTADARSPTYSHGFTMVPPIESRRDKLQRMRQKELDDLERYKEEHRPGPIQLNPEILGGGCVSLAEARQRQQVETRQSKLQKKLRKEEMDRIRRQAEEAEHQKKKTIQREKANRLEMKNKQEEDRRRELYQHDLRMKRDEHLQRLEKSSLVPMAASSSSPASSWARGQEHRETRRAEEQTTLLQMKEEQRKKSDILEEKQKQQEEDRKRRMEMERLRVNSAFLDRLEASRSGRAPETLPVTQEGGNVWQSPEPQDFLSSPTPFPSQVWSDGAEDKEEEEEEAEEGEKAEEDTDYDWVVMKLQQNFPYYERDLLKDIVCQCNGNYKQAYDLLNV